MFGHLRLDGDVIRYRSRPYGEWDLPLRDVRVIGERTNPGGPFADDYFLCFATGLRMWLEESFYAEGSDELLDQLGVKLGTSFEVGLCNSTDFASRALWPPPLAGGPMFTFEATLKITHLAHSTNSAIQSDVLRSCGRISRRHMS